ncbi:WD40-repeat-containing domain protein [Dichotomocladium elegans]|nr:WD40-repeat-containing domain protein [Dichotomocladium elegans]
MFLCDILFYFFMRHNFPSLRNLFLIIMSTSSIAPTYIFRKHSAAVNASCFFASDAYFATCDADGMICIWKMRTRRPILEWKAHEKDCMAVQAYGDKRLISQGRDNSIHIWEIFLPENDNVTEPSKRLLETLTYYSLNFCRLSFCQMQGEALICLPFRGDTSLIDVYSLTRRNWIAQQIGKSLGDRLGLCMAVRLFCKADNALYALAGYEDGTVALWRVDGNGNQQGQELPPLWQVKEHSGPVLDLAIDLASRNYAISTSADKHLVKYNLFELSSPVMAKAVTKKYGLSSVDIRSDSKIIATGGHDGYVSFHSRR